MLNLKSNQTKKLQQHFKKTPPRFNNLKIKILSGTTLAFLQIG